MKKSLIALAVIAAGLAFANSPEYAVGAKFEADEGVADDLIKNGLAKLDAPAADKATKAVKKTPVRILVDCLHGKVNDVVELDAGDLKAAEGAGLADSDKGAVAYAMTLDQNKPKKAPGSDVL